MNIIIPYRWLKEYLDYSLNPQKIAHYLSLCSASVEKIEKVFKDYLYHIEITTNRVDMMSILGVAREAAAVLNRFGYKANLKDDPYNLISNFPFTSSKKSSLLKVIIKNVNLCPRFAAVILDNVKVKPSPLIIQQRLKKVGLRPLNNIVDISNYLMHELGQPVHTFDYDKIGKKTMILRASKKGEIIQTLDGQKRILKGNDIIIEDGLGRIIDLCGIMGGLNTAIDKKTKCVLFFVQNYQAEAIRKTAMSIGLRTQAATLYEKKIDPELVIPTLAKGIELFKKTSQVKVQTPIIDIYHLKPKTKNITLSLSLLNKYLGLKIKTSMVKKILESLGFKTSFHKKEEKFSVIVPSWRHNDINLAEDLIEEISRIYGYHLLPSRLPKTLTSIPFEKSYHFYWEKEIKKSLKYWGFTETYTYSLQSLKELKACSLLPKNHLKLKNPLSEEWVYLRAYLEPSLLSVIKQNQNEKTIKIFEISKVYLPRKSNLPQEISKLILCQTGDSLWNIKGYVEAISQITNIKIWYKKWQNPLPWFEKNVSALMETLKGNKKIPIGYLGSINSQTLKNFSLNSPVSLAVFNFAFLSKLASKEKTYLPLPKFPPLIEDLTFKLNIPVYCQQIINHILSLSPLIKKVSLINHFQKSLTFRIVYLSKKKNLTSKSIFNLRKKIVASIEQKGWAKLKGELKDLKRDLG